MDWVTFMDVLGKVELEDTSRRIVAATHPDAVKRTQWRIETRGAYRSDGTKMAEDTKTPIPPLFEGVYGGCVVKEGPPSVKFNDGSSRLL